jgi:sigma-B regulation protein RsbU (phosphoserine phosphatase)
VLVIVFQPAITSLEDVVENLLRRRDQSDPQLVIQDLGRRLAAEVDLRGMRERVAAALQRGLFVEDACLMTVEDTPRGPVLDNGDRREALGAGALSRLVSYFESAPEPVLRHDLERALPRLADADRDHLHSWLERYTLLGPVMQQRKLRGILAVGPKVTGGRFHSEDLALLGLLGHQVTLSLENLRLLSENVQRRILEEEINLASEIQKGLLPRSFPDQPGYRTHAVSFASKFVGGDYFDVFSLDGRRLHVAIADVSGKGVPAALLMSYLQAALRSNVQHLESPADVLSRINDLLYECTAPEKFATFFYGTIDTEAHELVYANAGHNYPILVRACGDFVELADGGIVLGVFPGAVYSDGRVSIDEGDTLFLYTDGITEATNGGEEEFGSERLIGLLRTLPSFEPRALVEAVLAEVRAFTSGLDPADDLTMVVVRRLPVEVTADARG